MTISLVTTAAGIDTTNGASVVLPGAVAAGHRLIVVAATNSAIGGYSQVTPAGWSVVASSVGTGEGGDMIATVYTKVASSGDPGATVEFAVTPTGSKEGLCMAAYSGDVTTPEIVAAAVDGIPDAIAVTTVPSPDVTVDALPTLLVAGAAKKGGSTEITFTDPAGFTNRVKGFTIGGGAIAATIADMAAAATGSTTVADWNTSASSSHGVGFLLALAEGTPPPMVAPTFHRFTVSGWVPPLT